MSKMKKEKLHRLGAPTHDALENVNGRFSVQRALDTGEQFLKAADIETTTETTSEWSLWCRG